MSTCRTGGTLKKPEIHVQCTHACTYVLVCTYHRVLCNDLQHSFNREQNSEEKVDPIDCDPCTLKTLNRTAMCTTRECVVFHCYIKVYICPGPQYSDIVYNCSTEYSTMSSSFTCTCSAYIIHMWYRTCTYIHVCIAC